MQRSSKVSLLALGLLAAASTVGVSAQIVYKTSGNPVMDSQLNQESNFLAQEFLVTPDIYILDDSESPNAFATPNNQVLLGYFLCQNELRQHNGPFGNYSIICIMAHEFAHQVQFQRGLQGRLPTPILEQHADLLAGWYMARRSVNYVTDSNHAMRSLFQKGEYEFNSPTHHGTPEQRVGAFLTGVNLYQLDLDSVFTAGLQRVMNANSLSPVLAPPSTYAQFGCSLQSDSSLSVEEEAPADLR